MANYETCRKVITTNNFDYMDVVEETVKQLMQLPEKMVEEFGDNDWHIFITKGSIENHMGERDVTYNNPHIGGITVYEFRTIYIPVFPEDRLYAAAFATIHEFGHYLDRSKGLLSISYEFQKIYNTNDRTFCAKLCRASNTTSSTEFFAESFAIYVLNPEGLKEHCIDTYNYFEDLFRLYR